MDTGIRIGRFEYFAMFVVARLVGSLTFVGEGSMPIDTSAALLGQAVAAGLAFATFFLIVGLTRRAGVETPVQLCYLPGKAAGHILTAVLGLCSFLTLTQVINSFERYFTATVYPTSWGAFFIALFVLSILYFNHMGIDAMSRLSNGLFILTLIILALLVSGVYRDVDLTYLVTPFYEGVEPLLRSVYRSFVDWADLLVMAMVFAMVSGDARRPSLHVFWVALAVAELLSFLLITVMGPYSRMHLFPVHALFTTAEIWVPTRVDFLFMILFMAACLMKAALHLAFIGYCLRTLLPPGAGRYARIAPALLAGGAALVLSHSRVLSAYLVNLMNSGTPMLLMTLGVPLTAALLTKITGRRAL